MIACVRGGFVVVGDGGDAFGARVAVAIAAVGGVG